jgi:hypothetical protein
VHYRELKKRIKSNKEYGEYINYSFEIEELRLEKWKVELRELLEKKLNNWEQVHSEEDKLNKELEKLRNPSFLNKVLSLVEEKIVLKKLLVYYKGKNPIDK